MKTRFKIIRFKNYENIKVKNKIKKQIVLTV